MNPSHTNRRPDHPPSHRRPTNLDIFHWGVAYYPEHWPEDDWSRHARLMADAGVTLVRLAEFAWDRLEPRREAFDFAWLDRAIASVTEHGIDVMLCTPTAAPPRWITAADPTMLRVDADGRTMPHGSRQHASHCHLGFREHCKRITAAMAEHYHDRAEVVGWQTDNEFHCHFSEDHSEAARTAFAAWCENKYGEIASLNGAWGTAFWSQALDRFDQIVTPRDGQPTYANPSQLLDYGRFLSDAVADFQDDQLTILRAAKDGWWITHNGLFEHLDYRGRFTEGLDFLAYDTYPFFHPNPADRPAAHAFVLDRARGWSGNFFVPEHQVGAGGQNAYMHDAPRIGEMRQFVWRTIARGADGVLGFRWRSCPFGAEQYWQGVLDHHGQPESRYAEFRAIGEEIRTLGPELLGSWTLAEAAVAGVDASVTDGFTACSLGLPSPDAVAGEVHRALYDAGFATGVVHPADDLSDLKLLVIPHWAIFDPAWVPNLETWVRAGGTLVVGALTATRDVNNQIILQTPPGVLAELAGVEVEHFERVNDPAWRAATLRFHSLSGENYEDFQTEHWRESLRPIASDGSVEVLARWTHTEATSRLMDAPAVTSRRVGSGRVIYVGTYLTGSTTALVERYADDAGLRAIVPGLPEDVESVVRTDGKRKWLFLFNTHGSETKTIRWTTQNGPRWTLRIPASPDMENHVTLPPLGVAVFTDS